MVEFIFALLVPHRGTNLLKVGLTGGIATGKSLVSGMFREL
ncbi:MAG: dephospho-CoA kinase, partial [Acidobacteria bacterium]|nr:dephospho-CoA kinase [Acidobacteriota bacterium]